MQGIDEIRKLACQAQREILGAGQHKRSIHALSIFDEGEKVLELMDRIVVRKRFLDALGGRLEESDLDVLRKVLLNTAYSNPPSGWWFLRL